MCFTNEAITPFLQQSRALLKNTFSQISSFEGPSHSEGPSPTPGVQAVYRDRDCCPQGLQKNRGKRGKNCNKRKLNWCGGSRSMPAPSWLLTRPCPILCFLQESHLGYPLSSPYSITSQKETASIIFPAQCGTVNAFIPCNINITASTIPKRKNHVHQTNKSSITNHSITMLQSTYLHLFYHGYWLCQVYLA